MESPHNTRSSAMDFSRWSNLKPTEIPISSNAWTSAGASALAAATRDRRWLAEASPPARVTHARCAKTRSLHFRMHYRPLSAMSTWRARSKWKQIILRRELMHSKCNLRWQKRKAVVSMSRKIRHNRRIFPLHPISENSLKICLMIRPHNDQ